MLNSGYNIDAILFDGNEAVKFKCLQVATKDRSRQQNTQGYEQKSNRISVATIERINIPLDYFNCEVELLGTKYKLLGFNTELSNQMNQRSEQITTLLLG